ncbi:MAG: LPS export ABC transporter permease LptF [Wenzhouxiangellaceae bacterium]|nr:LPS export ABC transporter permease LptF [Wenzhouxiangellaceae bacterium]
MIARYLLRESALACLMSLMVLLAITLSLFLAELLGDVSEGKVVVSSLFQLLALRLPEAVLLTAPLALLIGLMMSFGELAQMREFSVMRAAGVRPGSIVRVVLVLALVWASMLILVSGWVAPWASRQSSAVAERIADDLLLASIRPGQFQPLRSTGLTIYVEQANADASWLSNIFLHYQGADAVEVITAKRASFGTHPETGARLLLLYDGVHIGHAQSETGLPLRRVQFARNEIELPSLPGSEPPDRLKQLPLPRLLEINSGPSLTELDSRLAPAVVSLVLVLLVLPVSLTDARGSRFGVVLIAIVLYLGYGNTVNLVLTPMDAGPDSLISPVWIVHMLAFFAALIPASLWWRKW